MAARPVTPPMLHATGRAALVLLAALCLAAASPDRCAAEEQKVWRALTEGEPRSRRPEAPTRAGPAAAPEQDFPSELVLALIAAGVLLAAGAASALLASRRARPAVPAVRTPAPSEEGSPLERLWRMHLRRNGAKRG